MKERGSFTVAFAGGSLPSLLEPLHNRTDVDWSKWHIFTVDERCVPHRCELSSWKLVFLSTQLSRRLAPDASALFNSHHDSNVRSLRMVLLHKPAPSLPPNQARRPLSLLGNHFPWDLGLRAPAGSGRASAPRTGRRYTPSTNPCARARARRPRRPPLTTSAGCARSQPPPCPGYGVVDILSLSHSLCDAALRNAPEDRSFLRDGLSHSVRTPPACRFSMPLCWASGPMGTSRASSRATRCSPSPRVRGGGGRLALHPPILHCSALCSALSCLNSLTTVGAVWVRGARVGVSCREVGAGDPRLAEAAPTPHHALAVCNQRRQVRVDAVLLGRPPFLCSACLLIPCASVHGGRHTLVPHDGQLRTKAALQTTVIPRAGPKPLPAGRSRLSPCRAVQAQVLRCEGEGEGRHRPPNPGGEGPGPAGGAGRGTQTDSAHPLLLLISTVVGAGAGQTALSHAASAGNGWAAQWPWWLRVHALRSGSARVIYFSVPFEVLTALLLDGTFPLSLTAGQCDLDPRRMRGPRAARAASLRRRRLSAGPPADAGVPAGLTGATFVVPRFFCWGLPFYWVIFFLRVWGRAAVTLRQALSWSFWCLAGSLRREKAKDTTRVTQRRVRARRRSLGPCRFHFSIRTDAALKDSVVASSDGGWWKAV